LPVRMPQLRDFLTRFRPAGSPGAAERAGVPADRPSELESEVGPVLALLADIEAERERLITQARRDAEQIVAAAQSAAGAVAADAAQRARTMREQAARQVMITTREQAARTVEDARQQAAQTRELARQRMPALVSRVVGTIRQLDVDDP
jgi:cell division septum initiation protein DivIVA